jgi:hypothetical protein
MRISELIESQRRSQQADAAKQIKETVEANKEMWDHISKAHAKSKLNGRDPIQFTGIFKGSFCDGELVHIQADESKTESGYVWITTFLVAPEIRPLVSSLSAGDRISATSSSLGISEIQKI